MPPLRKQNEYCKNFYASTNNYDAALYLPPLLTAIVEYAMNTLMLSQADSRRLERLALEAGRSQKEVLKHVLCDGFDATEQTITTVKARLQSVGRVPHEEAMQQLDSLIQQHGRHEKQAA